MEVELEAKKAKVPNPRPITLHTLPSMDRGSSSFSTRGLAAWTLELKPPNTWAKLGTGKLEIEVKSNPPQKQEQK